MICRDLLLCWLYVCYNISVTSSVTPSMSGWVFMGSVVLSIRICTLLLYPARSVRIMFRLF